MTTASCLVSAWLAGLSLAQQPEEFRISADVDHVVLPVTVVDRKGEFVAGLKQDSFKVYENGKPQQIVFFSQRDIAVTIGLVVDNSGSMTQKRPDTVLAALNFVRLSNPGDELFTVSFNENVSFGLPKNEPFTSDAARLRDSLLANPTTGRTALYDALTAGLEHLAQGSRDKKALILVSDGGDNASRHLFEDVLARAERSNVLIYAIGIFDRSNDDRNPGVLKKLARQTGGECYLPERTSELPGVCAHIAKELRSQYTLAYSPPSGAHDGGYRRIQVTASAPDRGKLSVRTRPGYFAPGPAEQARNPQP